MKTFCFTVDDNIRVLKELTLGSYESIFHHPYLAMYRRLHEALGLKVQLNLFFQMDGFDLTQMTDRFYDQWQENAHWLKLSFHSRLENRRPYEQAGYREVYDDCKAVHDQICRFASASALGRTTTIHYCRTTDQGLQALRALQVEGLLGLFGDEAEPRTSYELEERYAARLRAGSTVEKHGITYGPIDVVINRCSREKLLQTLQQRLDRDALWLMIHEQYFYGDYKSYQPDFEQKLEAAFRLLTENGYKSIFFEEMLGTGEGAAYEGHCQNR